METAIFYPSFLKEIQEQKTTRFNVGDYSKIVGVTVKLTYNNELIHLNCNSSTKGNEHVTLCRLTIESTKYEYTVSNVDNNKFSLIKLLYAPELYQIKVNYPEKNQISLLYYSGQVDPLENLVFNLDKNCEAYRKNIEESQAAKDYFMNKVAALKIEIEREFVKLEKDMNTTDLSDKMNKIKQELQEQIKSLENTINNP